MLPSMPLISTRNKDAANEESCSAENANKALDLSLSAKKLSPLKHVTPILRKYNTQRKGKKIGPQNEQTQNLRPLAPKPVMTVMAPTQEETRNESDSEVKETPAETSDNNKEERKDNEDELAALMRASTTIQSAKVRVSNVVRKKTKQMRDLESSVMLLTPDDPVVREEKSYGFAQAYFLKVKERLEGTELYETFLQTMNDFGTSIIEVQDLYYKVTSLLSEHPDLSEEFLAFLLPEQAMQCGKLMEYLMITKMRDFFRRLEKYFEKQPLQMRKFYSALSNLSEQNQVSLTDVRTTILPLFKGNSVLIDNFLNILPAEKPPESMMTDFEDMEIGDSNKVRDDDLFETLVIPNQPDTFGGDNCACKCHQVSPQSKSAHCLSCGTRVETSKIFLQAGKALRPAKVQFESETTYQSIKRLSTKGRPKVRNRKRTTVRFNNSPLKRAHTASGSRAKKSKSGQKGRAAKSCRRLVKSKTQSANKQTPVKSSTKSTQPRTTSTSRNTATSTAKSVSNAVSSSTGQFSSPQPDEIITPSDCDMIPSDRTVSPVSSSSDTVPLVVSGIDIPCDKTAVPSVSNDSTNISDEIVVPPIPNISDKTIIPAVSSTSDAVSLDETLVPEMEISSTHHSIPFHEAASSNSDAMPFEESVIPAYGSICGDMPSNNDVTPEVSSNSGMVSFDESILPEIGSVCDEIPSDKSVIPTELSNSETPDEN
ncbi:hypothetical protein L9F63_020440, partial [Diploptera punctata]